MLQFSNTPPPNANGPGMQLLRTPTGKALNAVVTSPDLIGCHTHFFMGRTTPHDDADCDACDAGIPTRWHTYLSACQCQTHLHFIFETTERGSDAFIDFRNRYGSLRGCQFTARRANSAINSRVLITTKRIDLQTIVLPPPPNLIRCMATIWNVPMPEINPDPVTNAIIGRIAPSRANGQPVDPLHVINM